MNFLKRLPVFLFTLISLWYAGLFGYFNLERIKIEMPYIGTFTIAIALTVLGSFIAGALFATVFFGFDFLRKSLKVAANEKRIRQLESANIARTTAVTSDKDISNTADKDAPTTETDSTPSTSEAPEPLEEKTSLPKSV